MMRRSPWLLPLLWMVLGAACQTDGSFDNPLLRVDLKDRMPAKARRTAISGIRYQCKKEITVPAEGLAPRFVIHWRVLDIGGTRYIVAVEVAPASAAPIEGLGSPRATATVGAMVNVGDKQAPVAALPVLVQWSGQKGCSAVGGGTSVQIRADDAGCKKPKTPKLLRSVK